ncbi:helix-turn-helix domain-containing protein [Marinitenerispora sediminis]|uniref:Transcriptional regulator n=2 Tax=Marinitenerispora sediminis TaxID=1931232 RepID=A0A368T944_9ACTN|nr:helix-turn-helix transcriptional regulator [Marinitenerispora sediminis]RCV52380.1 transcriptional regulator [Marinitenerispora sediminis]RCV60942.1 transcriptional regulator [Marinitenerispora sediminis]RCV62235.1 transcriptional regulator [Marinitenerispora sediminis]
MPVGRPKRVTLRGRWLGQRLRELRDENGMKVEEVGEYLQRSSGTISRFESGIYPIRRAEVVALLDLYGVNDARQRAGLLKIADDVWQTGWWDGYSGDVAGWFVDFVWLEELAVEQRLFENTVVPGIVQIDQYARAVMTAAEPQATHEDIERGVELRMKRRALLDRDDHIPDLSIVLDEAVLRRPVGGPKVLVAQLTHLSELAQRPSIDLRVLPYSVGAHASPSGGFSLFRMAEPYPEVAYVETPKGAIYIEAPDTEPIVEMYDRLQGVCLDPEDSIGFMSALIEELA